MKALLVLAVLTLVSCGGEGADISMTSTNQQTQAQDEGEASISVTDVCEVCLTQPTGNQSASDCLGGYGLEIEDC